MIVFFSAFLFFCSGEKKEEAKPKEKEPKYYFYEYKEGTVRCHVGNDNIITCLDVID